MDSFAVYVPISRFIPHARQASTDGGRPLPPGRKDEDAQQSGDGTPAGGGRACVSPVRREQAE